MLLKVDNEILDKVIELAKERLISFINILKIEDMYFIEYQPGEVNNSKKIVDMCVYLEKFKNALSDNTLKSFYLYYDIRKDELITQFSTINTSANYTQMELINLLENNKHFLVDKLKYIKVPNGKRTIKLSGENIIAALIDSLQESLGRK